MMLKDIAHARSGDKGDICNICIYAREPKYYDMMKREITEEKVKKHFKNLVKGTVKRYELPQLHGFNFVLYNALDGGATRSLRLDTLGKTMAAALLRMKI